MIHGRRAPRPRHMLLFFTNARASSSLRGCAEGVVGFSASLCLAEFVSFFRSLVSFQFYTPYVIYVVYSLTLACLVLAREFVFPSSAEK